MGDAVTRQPVFAQTANIKSLCRSCWPACITNRETNLSSASTETELTSATRLDGECALSPAGREVEFSWGVGTLGNRAEVAGEVGVEALLEGGAESSTLERLGRTVVVHHAALRLALSTEEQAAEFSHL